MEKGIKMNFKRKYVKITSEREKEETVDRPGHRPLKVSEDVQKFVERRRQRAKERRSIKTDAERHLVSTGQKTD